ncbi:hypothetical protein [Burkholderia thailandensis]|uniref:Gp47 n=1 Tax=Burkholderia thailandensis TaxID=57975 RepID=A0AAW9CQG1_BURTH|nr:hypothetical protein [Burkholderia thailandensis]UCR75689.1 hypothetical protein BtTXDOH_40 [Burkholderia phage phiBt-TXDOH]AIP66289.1 hypothetical protein DR62_4518 [Burkholderia thailandensis]AOI55520.1 hypothetical protein WI24_27710 [Burkholderia thailandensis]MCS3393157.1 hypothetical protein [Burkholderia thailandensis]MCS6426269.1 hypothetical protein [Burkholderia thailandensis]
MKELQQAVSAAFSNIVAAGAIEKAIEEKLTKTITSIIDEELRSYSTFGEQLKEHVKAALQVDFHNLGLPGYNDLILKIIRQQVDAQLNATIETQIEQQMKELLAPAPAEIKLSQLVEEFIKDEHTNRQYRSCSCDESDQITLIVREASGGSLKFHHIHLDTERGTDYYSCPYQIDVHDGRVYSVQLDRKDPSKTLFVGPMNGFKRRLFQLYAAGTKLIIDGDENTINTYYPGRDY